MKIAFFNLNCILRDRLLSRKIVTVYGGLRPAVTPVWSPPLLRKGLYMNLLTECTPACSPPRAATALISILVININYFARERRSDSECKSTRQRFLSGRDFLDLQLYWDFLFFSRSALPLPLRLEGRWCGRWQHFPFLSPKLALRRLNGQTSAALDDRDTFAVESKDFKL